MEISIDGVGCDYKKEIGRERIVAVGTVELVDNCLHLELWVRCGRNRGRSIFVAIFRPHLIHGTKAAIHQIHSYEFYLLVIT